MLALAHRQHLNNGGQASAVVAFSRSLHEPYKDGSGQSVQDYVSQSDLANVSSSDFDTDTGTGLVALEWQPNSDHKFEFTGSLYRSEFLDLQNSRYFWDITNNTYRLVYNYTPGNPLVNLSFDIWSNETQVEYDPSRPVVGASSSFAGRKNRTTTQGTSLSNRSEILMSSGDLVLDYGMSWRRDNYEGLNKDIAFGMNGQGELTVGGVFADALYSFGDVELSGGVNWMHYKLNGLSTRQACPTGYCDTHAERSGSAWSGNVKLAYNLSEMTQVYGGYAHTTRPPTIAEMFMPNIQSALSPTPSNSSHILNLVPETSRTFEIGGRHDMYGLISDEDKLTLEANLFHSRIENFIGYGISLPALSNPPTQQEFQALVTAMTQWRNSAEPVTMKGLELSASYDSDTWFGNLTATLSDTKQPVSSAVGIVSDDNAMPGRVATLELGRKFMNGEVSVGGRLHHVSDVTIKEFNGNPTFPPSAIVRSGASYNLVDLYASYSPSEKLTAYVQVENVADKFYLPVNAGQIGLGNTGGRGRNVTVGLNIRF
jgi:outer membrane receptor protein involved in Fe transport